MRSAAGLSRFRVAPRWAALATAVLGAASVDTSTAASLAPVAAEHGMVVTAHPIATRVGVDVLRQGGNAIDAAVAVGYALAVVFPVAGNLGGGGFMTIRLADGRTTFIDFRERAPRAATPAMYLDADGNVVAGLSTKGLLSAGVPGSVAGLEMARERYGTRRRGALMEPAIRLAEDGFALSRDDAEILEYGAADFRRDPASAAIFLDRGAARAAGSRWRQPDLARTLRRIRDRGTDGFYKGPVAAALAAAFRAGQGIVTSQDLADYRARERRPVECDYRGHHVVTAPPPSSGGVTLCEVLGVLGAYPLHDLGYHSAAAVHVEIEAMRRAYVDRNTYLGDPDFVADPADRLLSAEHLQSLRASIDPNRATDSRTLGAGSAPHEGDNTTHYAVVDRWGNAVSVTTTLNGAFGARVTAAGTGVLLNDEMDDFTVKPGVPNLYGLVQGEANAIAPGKRPLSSMTPTIVLRGNSPLLVVGAAGGSRITTAVAQVIVDVVDYGMNVQEAVDAPRLHQQWLPPATGIEPFALSPDTRRLLEAMGHEFGGPVPTAQVEAILVGGAQRLYGAGDPRRGAATALGY